MWRETSYKAYGSCSMQVRRTVKENTGLKKNSVLEYMDILKPGPGSKYHIKFGDWKEFPKRLSDFANSSLTKVYGKGMLNAFTNTDKTILKNRRTLEEEARESKTDDLKDEEDDFKSAVSLSRFLRRANLIPRNTLQSGIKLPEISRLGFQCMAIEGQQVAVAVGCYFGDTSLAESAPDLGALMGCPSREVLEESIAMSNLTALIVAMACQNKIPEGKPVNASYSYRYEWESPEPQEESIKAELYAHISDCKTKETYVMFPLAYETRVVDSRNPKDIKPPVRTFANEVRDKDFERIATGQFSVSS